MKKSKKNKALKVAGDLTQLSILESKASFSGDLVTWAMCRIQKERMLLNLKINQKRAV